MSGTPLVGYMAVFDTPSAVVMDHRGRRHRLVVDPGALDNFIALKLTAPLLLRHQAIITNHGVQPSVGTVRDWRADEFGCLVRAEVEDSEIGDAVVLAVRRGDLWAMSWGIATFRQDPAEVPEPTVCAVHGAKLPTVRLLEAGVAEVTTVTVRDRVLGTEGEPPIMLATSYFPAWVIDKAPDLREPGRGGMPEILRAAFGETYSHDVLTARMPTPQEQERLDLPPGTPVLVIKGGTYDQQARPLHFIEVIAAGGRIEFAYLYGERPSDS